MNKRLLKIHNYNSKFDSEPQVQAYFKRFGYVESIKIINQAAEILFKNAIAAMSAYSAVGSDGIILVSPQLSKSQTPLFNDNDTAQLQLVEEQSPEQIQLRAKHSEKETKGHQNCNKILTLIGFMILVIYLGTILTKAILKQSTSKKESNKKLKKQKENKKSKSSKSKLKQKKPKNIQ